MDRPSRTQRLVAALTARYDDAALRVEPPVALDPARLAAAAAARGEPWSALAAWCAGAPGLACAVLHGPDLAALVHLVQAFARERDGTVRLEAAAGAAGRLRIRLATKLHDAMGWRPRSPSDPWDCGWTVDDAPTREALRRFAPRRATFVACQDLAAFGAASAALQANAAAFAHPVRLLGLAESPGTVRFSAASPCGGSTGTAR